MPPQEILTPALLENIQRGEAVLFLGAGASFGAVGSSGQRAPSGAQLRDIICDRFLGGSLKDKPLSQVAEFAKNEVGLLKFQEAIRDLFLPLQPAPFHSLVPRFRWHAIVTTNIDLVLERAYDKCADRQQALAPIVSDRDNFIDRIRDQSQAIYLKLHGCISHIADDRLPLILATEEYAKYRNNRERLFRHFQDWGRERPIIFCGYDVGDPNIQQILFDLSDLGMSRPIYALVNPGVDGIASRYWASKRFVVHSSTFEAFMGALDQAIPIHKRELAALVSNTNSSIRPWIKTKTAPSTNLLLYLEKELLHVHKTMPTVGVAPVEFYRGAIGDWGVPSQDLDIYRRVTDDIILEAFLNDANSKVAQAYVLKGYAGSGKSITLRRVAWDVAHQFDGLIFALREGGVLRRDRIHELHVLTGERVRIVIDDAIPVTKECVDLLSWAEKNAVPLTLILGARTNEWNVYAGDLDERVDNDYELKDLTEREIGQLIGKLQEHKALGRLANATEDEKRGHFKLSAERQLLVALLDISGEKPFEEIVLDEYRNIRPSEAQILYLDVCTLHRLGVGVRAGLVSRVSGITFENFRRDFFLPLEHVVRTYMDEGTRDNMYKSRHRLIAETVFKNVLSSPADRVNQIVRLIRNMDTDYASDRAAFGEMIRGRQLADLFAQRGLANQIFDAARESGAPRPYIEHQRAVFELNHPNGELDVAMEALEIAERELDHPDRAILHTKATVLRQLALKSTQRLARENFRERAKAILQKQTKNSRVPHPFGLGAQLLIDELKDKIASAGEGVTASPELQQRSIAETIRQVEGLLLEGLQKFPGDNYILSAESDLAKLLSDEQRAVDALARAFETNPGSAPIAIRLAEHKGRGGNTQIALEILKKSLAVNDSKETHFALARTLMGVGEEQEKDGIAYHLKKSYADGDSNLDAQFWFARHGFLFGDRAVAVACFKQLGEAWTPPEYRKRVKGIVMDKNGVRRRFQGSVEKVRESFVFLQSRELKVDVFAHMNQFEDVEWVRVQTGVQVTFELGFAMRGPQALNVRFV